MDRANRINMERGEGIRSLNLSKVYGFVRTPQTRFLFAICIALLTAILVSHAVATWMKLPKARAHYRRIGPETGPQVFCAGSSLLQFGLSWPDVSAALGQGIENWGVAGSSPSEWEASQKLALNTNLMIIGFSVHDLNENYLCDTRANIVPIGETIHDLWQSKTDWHLSKRVLSQYPLAYLRLLFPTAGKSDAVLVGFRKKLRELSGSPLSAEDKANFLLLPRGPVLNFGDSGLKLSNWPADKVLRRLTLLRKELQGPFRFDGPKHLAFLRMLDYARQRGRVIVVVLPVAEVYNREFVTPEVVHRFEGALTQAQQTVPQAEFVRLDHLPTLKSDECFDDFVHLNIAGRRLATEAFLKQLGQDSRLP
jgi:hypothetical protein